MKLTSPYFLIGLVAIVVGLGLYFFDMFTFTMYVGLPMTTIVLAIVGLILIFLEFRKK